MRTCQTRGMSGPGTAEAESVATMRSPACVVEGRGNVVGKSRRAEGGREGGNIWMPQTFSAGRQPLNPGDLAYSKYLDQCWRDTA